MVKFMIFESVVVLLLIDNVDMDQIILVCYFKVIDCSMIVEGLFVNWCYWGDDENFEIDFDFVFNQLCYEGVQVFFVGDNFGCGSLWEYVFWVFYGNGFCVVLSICFVDIFCSNLFKNGLFFVEIDVVMSRDFFVQVCVVEELGVLLLCVVIDFEQQMF